MRWEYIREAFAGQCVQIDVWPDREFQAEVGKTQPLQGKQSKTALVGVFDWVT